MLALEPPTPASTTRQPSKLYDPLNKRLLTYMTAAAAAGVSTLAMTQPAHAEIVYTPADKPVHWGGSSDLLDLNNDGIPDFGFQRGGLGNFGSYFAVALKGNRIMNGGKPLAAGVSVGPGGSFVRPQAIMADFCICSGEDLFYGPWVGVRNEYMGYEFVINGSAHFGWARFSVTDAGLAKLTGYAYETVPLKPILTGDTGSHGNNDEKTVNGSKPHLQPASLGHLALGAAGRTGQ